MSLLRGPAATASIMNAVHRHEAQGRVVTAITISEKLHEELLADLWEFAGEDLQVIGKFMEIPVKVENSLHGMDFFIEVENGQTRNDA